MESSPISGLLSDFSIQKLSNSSKVLLKIFPAKLYNAIELSFFRHRTFQLGRILVRHIQAITVPFGLSALHAVSAMISAVFASVSIIPIL